MKPVKDFSYLTDLVLSNDTIKFELSNDLTKDLKRFFLEMKVQVDRWDLVTDAFVFHTDMKSIVLEFMKSHLNYYFDGPNIWGATLYFTKDIPPDHVFAVSLAAKDEGTEDNRHVSLGILPSSDVKRFYELKAFW